MIKLIDAEKLMKTIMSLESWNVPDFVYESIKNAPTVWVMDEESHRCLTFPKEKGTSVRHGHWIEKSKVYPDFPYDSTYNYECSNCGYMDTHGADVEVPYCWHCGAKMDEVEE